VKATIIGIRTLADYSIWLKDCQQKPNKLKLDKMSKGKIETIKAEVQRLLDARSIREVRYPQ
jgi:hypothetical protein